MMTKANTPALPEFVPYPKTPRWNRELVITEKIDGTNGGVYVDPDGALLGVGSKNRWLSAEKGGDNYGFYSWVMDRREAFEALGPGWHHGEFYGGKIQRGYGRQEKRFMLFNSFRWNSDTLPSNSAKAGIEWPTVLMDNITPSAVFKFKGEVISFDAWTAVEDILFRLGQEGSAHVPGYMQPEGLVIYHTASRQSYKVLCENDEGHKG